ncbi:hypothetical protein [Streptomyces sp. NPDC001903]|uniref:hypothetical protein n=1 Tax=Streptomyces sp. NPDC001903 TaxID=3364622 RepID=UPI0036A94E71
MLASLLPGIRELRTPLATGYLYLLTLFLIVAGSIPTRAEAHEPLSLLYNVVEWMGKPAAFAAGTFVAYLLGSVLEVHAITVSRALWALRKRYWLPDRRKLNHVLESQAGRSQWRDLPGDRPHDNPFLHLMAAQEALTKSAVDTLAAYCADRLGRPVRSSRTFAEALAPLIGDLPQLRTRLHAASKDLYGDYDRLAAEADLKVNVGAAAIVLSVLAAIQVEPWWALVCGPMMLLIYRGLSLARQANDVLVQAIVTGVVQSPKFDAYIASVLGDSQREDPARDSDY